MSTLTGTPTTETDHDNDGRLPQAEERCCHRRLIWDQDAPSFDGDIIAKSDAADAVILTNILRLDRQSHRPIPDDTDPARAIKVLARALQNAVWARTALGNQIRSLLKDYFPAALAAFDGLSGGGITPADARTVLAAAPTPQSTTN